MLNRKNQLVIGVLLALSIVACGRAGNSGSDLDEGISGWNRPENLPGATGGIEYRLDQLPRSGQSSHTVWSGDWLPYSRGGAAKRTSPFEASALEKYDMVTNSQGLATSWEWQQVRRYGGYAWAGHCNGLAAAGSMTKSPVRGVYYRGVYFSPEDIRTLLVELWQGGGSMVGGRCDRRNVATDAAGRFVAEECRDLNAGTFHINLTNFLGRFQTSLIFDITALEQVWNYPATNFQVVYSQALSASDANRYIGSWGDHYQFNSSAVGFTYYKTQVSLASGHVKEYQYVVETDAQGLVIGGEWVGQSKYEHPDFMWRHTTPRPDNPHIDANIINEIHAQSL